MRWIWRGIGAAGVACAIAAGGAMAQERVVPLDTVTVSVHTRAAEGLGSGGRSVLTLDAEAIRRTPASTVMEALHWAFGVDLMARSPALADVAIRGSSFEQVLVLVDGARMNDAQTGHFNLDLAVPLEQVERIEILRGPAASVHGADAMAGVINIITRRSGTGSMARLEVGSFGTTSLTLAHAAHRGGLRADLALEGHRSDGHRAGTDHEMGSARLALALPVASSVLRADLALAARDFGADGFYAAAPSFERTRTITGSVRARAEDGRAFTIEPLLTFRRHTDDFILRRHDPGFYRNEHASTQLSGEVIARGRWSEGVRSAAGLFAYQDRIESRALGDHREGRLGAMVELSAGHPGALLLSGGIRADWHESDGSVLSPSAALAWSVHPQLRVRTSAGTGFRPPTWTERYYRDPEHLANPDLAPERAWSAEAGFDFLPLPGARLAMTASFRQARDLIDWAREIEAQETVWRTRNVDTAQFAILEGELELDEILGIRWTTRGSWLALRSSAEPDYLSKYALRPLTRSFALTGQKQILTGLELTLHALHAERIDEPAYTRVDSNLGYTIRRSRLTLDVQNLLGERYLDIEGMPAPGRSLALGVAIAR